MPDRDPADAGGPASDPLRLDGRRAIVCGASTGIGLGIAESLTEAGCAVLMTANEPEDLAREADRLGCPYFAAELARPDELRSLVEVAKQKLGGIDILVHNGAGAPDSAATDVRPADLRAAYEVMVEATVRLTQLVLPELRRSPAGRIIAITSSSVREPIEGMAISNVFRPGVAGWLKMLSRELGPEGITVNSIGPGRIETRTLTSFYEGRSRDADLAEIPLGRFGTPREIGETVRFLASDGGAYITGVHLPVDGGLGRAT